MEVPKDRTESRQIFFVGRTRVKEIPEELAKRVIVGPAPLMPGAEIRLKPQAVEAKALPKGLVEDWGKRLRKLLPPDILQKIKKIPPKVALGVAGGLILLMLIRR